MSTSQIQHEIDEGVIFWGYEDSGQLSGVMGMRELATGPVLKGSEISRNILSPLLSNRQPAADLELGSPHAPMYTMEHASFGSS